MRSTFIAALAALLIPAQQTPSPARGAGQNDIAVVLAGAPAPGATAVGGPLRTPFALASVGNDWLIAELTGQKVLKLDAQGRLTTFAGTGKKGSLGDGGPATQAEFNGMHHLLALPSGDVLIADTWNNRVRKIDARSGVIANLVGTGEKGFSGDGGPAAKSQCGGIYSIAFDPPRKRLLVTDLDNRRIRVVTLADGRIETLAGNGQKGTPADGALAREAPLVDPRAVACDAAGNVYILERGGNALRAVDLQGRIRTVAGAGRKGPPADDVAALQATFNGPKHICVDRQGDVIVADAENHVVVKLLVRQGRVVRIAGTGKRGSAGVGGSPLRLELNRPHGVFVDRDNRLYIVDSSNDRVLKIERR